MDSIARLIENGSTCGAIIIVDGSFVIATNKPFPSDTNTKDQGYVLIDTVMSFLKKVSEGKYSNDEFKEIFKEICVGAMTRLRLSTYMREKLKTNDFIDRIIQSGESEDFRKLRDYLSEQAENGHYPSDIGAAFVLCSALLKDFNKVIKFIRDNTDKEDDLSATSFIQAIKNYKKDNIVTKQTLEGKVGNIDQMHSEMRLVSVLKDKLANKNEEFNNYIGISKLCCLDCHCIIYGINQAEDFKNTIEIRGAHNVEHSGNWTAPFNITGAAGNLQPPKLGRLRGSEVDTFSKAVIGKYTEARNLGKTQKKDTIGASGVVEYADFSSSSEGEGNEEFLVNEVLDKLETGKEQLERMRNIPGITIDDKVFGVVNQLISDIKNQKSSLRDWITGDIRNMVVYLRNLNDNKDLSITLNDTTKIAIGIFSNPAFVGSKISNKFSEIEKQLKFKQHKTEYISTKPDGNCTFNAFALGLCDLVLAGKLDNHENIYNFLKKELNLKETTSSCFKKWLEENNSDDIRQIELQGILRKIAVEYIKNNYESFYKEQYENILVTEFEKYLENDEYEDDTFMIHPHIKNKFKDLRLNFYSKKYKSEVDREREKSNILEELKIWWENEGKQPYFNTMIKKAESAGDKSKWGGGQEIGALASYLGINVVFKKGNIPQQSFGIGCGIIENLSDEEISLLHHLEIGGIVGKRFLLDIKSKEELENRISPLKDPLGSQFLEFINNATGIKLLESLGNIKMDEKIKSILKERGIINNNDEFINDGKGNLEKDRIKNKIKGVQNEELKQKILSNFKEKEISFGIKDSGQHWNYLRMIDTKKDAENNKSAKQEENKEISEKSSKRLKRKASGTLGHSTTKRVKIEDETRISQSTKKNMTSAFHLSQEKVSKEKKKREKKKNIAPSSSGYNLRSKYRRDTNQS